MDSLSLSVYTPTSLGPSTAAARQMYKSTFLSNSSGCDVTRQEEEEEEESVLLTFRGKENRESRASEGLLAVIGGFFSAVIQL